MAIDISRFLTSKYDIYEKSCMNHGNKEVNCHACTTTCPTESISFQLGTPVINNSKCIDCGACVSACPTLAIDHKITDYISVMNKINSNHQQPITCESYSKFSKGIKIPCYFMLDTPLLLTISQYQKDITFHIDDCKSCLKQLKINGSAIINHFADLQSQLDEMGVHVTIKTSQTPPVVSVYSDEKGISRRDFFKSIMNFRNTNESSPTESNDLPVKKRMLFKKNLINKALMKHNNTLSSSPLQSPYYFSITLTGSCTGCSLCTKLCPTDALHWLDKDDVSSLHFQNKDCVGCNKCVACPEEVIELTLMSPRAYVMGGDKTLVDLEKKKCKHCHDSFQTNDEKQSLCHICRVSRQKSSVDLFEGLEF
ncbi:4Fe-4S dicluster domain-containing protein [Bacillus sp. HMF5848]|uniref:4Fe-4S dicluster domain-containing protein n=1 Tax=Bacillus sp. HMF5848 TaxID=2495421 RepID=UPI000F78C559|nr:4Fe-4S dicluster domain-containing protein [Bacillus sp. HMF5848]RSK26197.1 4Fe-4S dicluster domain-containing protein [Bacillus sp. HMF5848]